MLLIGILATTAILPLVYAVPLTNTTVTEATVSALIPNPPTPAPPVLSFIADPIYDIIAAFPTECPGHVQSAAWDLGGGLFLYAYQLECACGPNWDVGYAGAGGGLEVPLGGASPIAMDFDGDGAADDTSFSVTSPYPLASDLSAMNAGNIFSVFSGDFTTSVDFSSTGGIGGGGFIEFFNANGIFLTGEVFGFATNAAPTLVNGVHLGGSGNSFNLVAPLGVPPTNIVLSKFFTDSDLNPLPLDHHEHSSVNVVFANGVIRSTNPGQVIAWVKATNEGTNSLDSLQLTETLSVDWTVHPEWDPARGAVHVFFEFSDGSRVEITDSSTIAATTSNPEIVSLSIPSITAAAGKDLEPDESIVVSVKMDYALEGTSPDPATYPIDYADTAEATAWTMADFTGDADTDSITAFFTAHAKVTGDVDGDMDIDLADAFLLVNAYNSQRGDTTWDARADFDFNGVIDANDATLLSLYYKDQ